MFYQGIKNWFVEGQILTMNVSILGFDLGSMLHFLTQHLWNYDSKLMCFVAFFSQYLIQFNIALSGANYQQRNYFTTIIKPIFFTVKRTCNPSNVSSDWRYVIAGGSCQPSDTILSLTNAHREIIKSSQRSSQLLIRILFSVLLWIIFNLSWNVRRPLPW